MPITMSRAEYDALIAAGLADDTTEIKRLQTIIDGANSIIRYRLQIRWQDIGGSRPTHIQLGLGWPTDQSFLLELERPIARADVDIVTSTQAQNPVSIMVTRDPEGIVAWTLVDSYLFAENAS